MELSQITETAEQYPYQVTPMVPREQVEKWLRHIVPRIQTVVSIFPVMTEIHAESMSVDEMIAAAKLNRPTAMDGGEVAANMLFESAAMDDKASIVNAVVYLGADINAVHEGNTPLMECCAFGTPDCVETLVKLKADVNYTDDQGSSALILAAYRDKPELVQALATFVGDDLKVDPTAQNNTSALYLAAQEGFVNVVKALLSLKPAHVQKFINTPSAAGIAPLYLAAHAGDESHGIFSLC